MHLLRLFLVYIHLIGFALLLGGGVMQYLAGRIRISSAMLWGSVIQIVSGLALAASARADGDDGPPTAQLAVKLVIAVLIFVMVFVPRHRERVNRGHFLAIIGLTLANAAIAVFWY